MLKLIGLGVVLLGLSVRDAGMSLMELERRSAWRACFLKRSDCLLTNEFLPNDVKTSPGRICSAGNKILAQDVLKLGYRDFARHPLGAGKPPPAVI
ncbi:hypothetical protein IVB18_28020 [Bradyrhizobium sp. 186]|uniref:hypothetical protein n=1 Tax=Bradyrhizobium sp. 186 TaxID=2782654 RepID=UPI002000D445|nr:hypothetical protein [Bradyrhizobium sp. 186]UPK32140.1 hypothetical protein IVB18_28020 [Bradyrhizobium sp. 186]